MTKLRILLLRIAVLGLSLAIVQPARAALIQLRPRCTATSSVIRLGEVAEIRDADPAVVQRLEAVMIQPAPGAGRRARVRLSDIKARLQALGENIGAIEFRGASVSVVQAPKLAHGPDKEPRGVSDHQVSRIERQVATAIGRFLDQQGAGTHVTAVSIPSSADSVRAILLTNVSSWRVTEGESLGSDTRKYLIHTGGRSGREMRFEATAKVAPMPRMLVLRRPVERGHVIQYQDLAWKPVAELPQRKAIRNDPRSVVGMEAVRPLPEGRALGERDVRKTLLIKRGDTVHVYSRWGGVKITAVARSREDGAYGDQVMLRILDNDETVVAKVIGFHVAEITPSLAQPSPRDRGLRIQYADRLGRSNRRRGNVVQTPGRFSRR